ncbi:hypothetical protein EDB92DRAFT_1956329 [Lactarius akahatsu]|uniref:Uncharacterized protein n=1 Tax=Lactarius akahatsu TaxID=416441 RepID=A0AAD4L8S8_9AGAM|nr:hypothetical protein EDB92DRAFT_1956329 [Lactarius akahatsu]
MTFARGAPDASSRTYRVAFAIDPVHATETTVKRYAHRVLKCELIVRAQQDGYTLERVDVHGNGKEGPVVMLVRGSECYVGGTTVLLLVLGSEPLEKLADTVWRAVGPSGRNKGYVYDLAAAVRARWRYRRTTRTSFLLRCVSVARAYILRKQGVLTKIGSPPASLQARLPELDRASAGSAGSELQK